MTAETVGFIGIGTMGQPMARCLGTAGFALVVNDIDGAAAEVFATEIGASSRCSIASVNSTTR